MDASFSSNGLISGYIIFRIEVVHSELSTCFKQKGSLKSFLVTTHSHHHVVVALGSRPTCFRDVGCGGGGGEEERKGEAGTR